jgi:putative FmdB family regulatory protein
MPIYTYRCRDCGQVFDLLVGVTSEKPELKCKKCNSKSIEKTFGTFSVGSSGSKSEPSGPSCPTGICPTCQI